MGEESTSKEFKDSDTELTPNIIFISLEQNEAETVIDHLAKYNIPHYVIKDFFGDFVESHLDFMPHNPETLEEVEAWWENK